MVQNIYLNCTLYKQTPDVMKKNRPTRTVEKPEDLDAVLSDDTPVHKRKNHRGEILPGKKLTDFVFEFMLIFLAISGGFFANNLRENIIDRKKEKEFIASMVRDLEEDTASVRNIMINDSVQAKGLDSLLTLLDTSGSDVDIYKFYSFCGKYLPSYTGFESRDITISQLENSGGLRLIRDKAVLDSIVLYYSTYTSHREQDQFNSSAFQQIIDMEIRYFHFSIMRTGNAAVTLPDPAVMREFYNRILIFNLLLQQDHYWLKQFHNRGSSLIRFLRKEYAMD